MEDVKDTLKLARTAIDNSNFEEAISKCKTILKKDKNNYLALVMLGVALQDSNQAPLAFRKAISLKNDKVLAWQGLASYYEKNNSEESKDELIPIYQQLLIDEMNVSKYTDICDKIHGIGTNCGRLVKCGTILLNQYNIPRTENGELKQVALQKLLQLLTDINSDEIAEEGLTFIDNAIFELNLEYLNDKMILNYLKCVLRLKCFDEMIKVFVKLFNLKKYESIPSKEWICKVYCENYILQEYASCKVFINLTDNLLSLDSQSVIGNLTKAIIYFQNKDILKAYNIAQLLPDCRELNILINVFLALCCLKLRRWLESESIAIKLTQYAAEPHLTIVTKILMIALASQNDEQKCLRAIEMKDNMNNERLTNSENVAIYFAYLYLKKFQEAEDLLDRLGDKFEFLSLRGVLYKEMGDIQKSLEFLEKHKTNTDECWFYLGKIYMEEKQYEKAILPLLQAAKYDPHNYSIFVYLGDYYSSNANDVYLEKAKKCYLKAFTLNPECSNAGKFLSSVYRKLRLWEDNYTFLKNLTNLRGCRDSWSLLELGLHHLALEQWDEAIVNLRTFVRWNPDDTEAWESLADAYYSRGSFTSALKCYKRVIDLDKKRNYSLVQIGSIQYILGDFNEALKTYLSIEHDSFLPALKGMAEVRISIANDFLSKNLYGLCQENAQEAVNLVTSAIEKEGQFSCLWNILSIAILIITKLPSKYNKVYVKTSFYGQSGSEKVKTLEKNDVYILAIQCYCRSINLSTNPNCNLYYELAVVYLNYYKLCGDITVAHKAISSAKKCVEIDSNEWQYWNLLGVICMHSEIKKYNVAQHAFIKAIQIDFSNAMVWSNLGVLYFQLRNRVLANKCFEKAQQFDPLYIESWIGQSLIAESVGHEDAMDLFRHSSQLGFHKESSLGYAEWVCKSILNSIDKSCPKVEYQIKNMHAIPTACDLMAWLNEFEDENACCLNIYGILLEKMGILHKATGVYEEALKYVDDSNRDIVLVNIGRMLTRIGKYDRAIETYKSVSKISLNSACGLAYALFKTGNLNESFTMYNMALQRLTNNENVKADLLVAMASMAHPFQSIDSTVTMLFQSVKMNPENPSISALLGAFALGIMHSNNGIIKLIMVELTKLKNKKLHLEIIAFVESYLCLKNDSPVTGIRILQRNIIAQPENSLLWEYLTKFSLLSTHPNPEVANTCVQKIKVSVECVDKCKYFIMRSISELLLGNYVTSKAFAQKAIHIHPDNFVNWGLLIGCLLPVKNVTNFNWIQNLLEYTKSQVSSNKPFTNWLHSIEKTFITV